MVQGGTAVSALPPIKSDLSGCLKMPAWTIFRLNTKMVY
jgi:hypothetical protein